MQNVSLLLPLKGCGLQPHSIYFTQSIFALTPYMQYTLTILKQVSGKYLKKHEQVFLLNSHFYKKNLISRVYYLRQLTFPTLRLYLTQDINGGWLNTKSKSREVTNVWHAGLSWCLSSRLLRHLFLTTLNCEGLENYRPPFSLLKRARELLTAAAQPPLQRSRRTPAVPTAPSSRPDQGSRFPRLPPQKQAPRFSPSCWQTHGRAQQPARHAAPSASPEEPHQAFFSISGWRRGSQGWLDPRSRACDSWLAQQV